MTIVELKKRCDFKYCDKVRGVTSVTIFEQIPYQSWGTLHSCKEHRVQLEEMIRTLIKPSVSKRFKRKKQ